MSGISLYCRGCHQYRPRYQFRADQNGLCRCCDPPVRSKVCRECGEDRPIGEYHVDRKARDGRRPVCRHCRNPHHKASYQARKQERGALRRTRRGENRSILSRLIASPWA